MKIDIDKCKAAASAKRSALLALSAWKTRGAGESGMR